MSKKNAPSETKKLAYLPWDVLYAKDIPPADVEDKVSQGILNALDKF
jgi:hypothetical protein